MRLRLLALAGGIVLAADAVLLVGVAAARRGTPAAELRLTGREFILPPRNEETSTLTARLRWWDGRYGPREPFLDAAKLAALGFDASSQRPAAKLIYVVLELRPDAPEDESRLKLVDTGLDAAFLRSRYADRQRYAVATGVAHMRMWNRLTPPAGWVRPASPGIYVPPEYMRAFRQASYEVNLCYDRNGDPWICGAR